ncbi:MAG: AAA family ATPase [Prevotellaceae bacterium]|jgi:MoxR-like ATPase|nr:AAA family ATPase [Prevotellaceae bacterium]
MEIKQVRRQNDEYLCDIDVSVEEWKQILLDKNLMLSTYKNTLIRFYNEPGHSASCKAMGEKYKLSPTHFNSSITHFAKAVQKKLNRFEILATDGTPTYWAIPMTGKYLGAYFEWTIRPELVQAMEETGMAKMEIEMEYVQEIDKQDALTNSCVNLILSAKNLILTGAPGTGKTWTAKDIAEQLIFNEISPDKSLQTKRLKNSEQFKLVQFHPAYSYEDFVRGIVVKTDGGMPEYIAENKILGKFAQESLKNYEDSKKQPQLLSKENWIDEQFEKFVEFIEDFINQQNKNYELSDSVKIISIDGDTFRYTGNSWKNGSLKMYFKDIKQIYIDENETRQDVKRNANISAIARQHASYYTRITDRFKQFLKDKKLLYKPYNETLSSAKEKNYVLVIDEINRANLPAVLGELIYALEYRGEKVESMYDIDGDNSLILPPNLYIIGTMNTADRSVGQIDYAIRRRFAFEVMLPKILEIDGFDRELFEKVSKLFVEEISESIEGLKKSEYLSDEFRPEDVWLGHSYFIMSAKKPRNRRLQYEIKPILREYLKDGILKSSAEKIINELQ